MIQPKRGQLNTVREKCATTLITQLYLITCFTNLMRIPTVSSKDRPHKRPRLRYIILRHVSAVSRLFMAVGLSSRILSISLQLLSAPYSAMESPVANILAKQRPNSFRDGGPVPWATWVISWSMSGCCTFLTSALVDCDSLRSRFRNQSYIKTGLFCSGTLANAASSKRNTCCILSVLPQNVNFNLSWTNKKIFF